jgi:hypothetical protein
VAAVIRDVDAANDAAAGRRRVAAGVGVGFGVCAGAGVAFPDGGVAAAVAGEAGVGTASGASSEQPTPATSAARTAAVTTRRGIRPLWRGVVGDHTPEPGVREPPAGVAQA